MIRNKQGILLVKIVMGYLALCTGVSVFAANWSAVPYGFAHGGARGRLDWWLDFKKKLSFEGIGSVIGMGLLANPSKLDDWLLSGEGLYYRNIAWSETGTAEQGVFVLGKLTLPRTEGIENFAGIGLGGLWLTRTLKEGEAGFSSAGMLYVGRNWHMSNGYYLTLRGTYIYPGAKNRQQSLSVTLGCQWNFF
jgi:hypothetical protein